MALSTVNPPMFQGLACLSLSKSRAMLASVSEAATAINRGRATIYRLITAGLLGDWERPAPDGRMRLELEGLEDRVARLVRQQANSRPKQQKLAAPSSSADWWDEVATVANIDLDCPCWAPPPWSGLQWAVLVGVAQMAADEVDGCG